MAANGKRAAEANNCHSNEFGQAVAKLLPPPLVPAENTSSRLCKVVGSIQNEKWDSWAPKYSRGRR